VIGDRNISYYLSPITINDKVEQFVLRS